MSTEAQPTNTGSALLDPTDQVIVPSRAEQILGCLRTERVALDGTWDARTRVLPARDLVAILLAGAGALLVFVSFLVDWQVIKIANGATVHAGIADIPTWGTAYVLGAMALVAVFVCVVALPIALGRTARVLGIGWAMGVAAIIAAMLVRLTDTPAISASSVLRDLLAGTASPTGVTVEWGAGIVYAAVSVVLLIGAFIAACPPLREGGAASVDLGR